MEDPKFRAWSIEDKRWHYFTLTDLIIGKASKNSLDYELWCQYLGYPDCNGKEIYDGDIVEDVRCEARNSWGIVAIDPNEWTAGEFIKGNSGAFEYKGFLELLARNRIQIIGNVYENPDRVEDLKEYFPKR